MKVRVTARECATVKSLCVVVIVQVDILLNFYELILCYNFTSCLLVRTWHLREVNATERYLFDLLVLIGRVDTDPYLL